MKCIHISWGLIIVTLSQAPIDVIDDVDVKVV